MSVQTVNTTVLVGRKGKPDREVKLFPWHAKSTPSPWPAGYSRVMIPFNEVEARNAKPGKTHHVQVVNNSRIRSH